MAGSVQSHISVRTASLLASGRMPAWLVILLGSLSAVGPLSTDMYLPAFPAIDHALGAGSGAAQITLAAWFVGLAIGQFTQGPASDRWGRRAPLLVGLAVYTAASLGCTLSHGLWSFCIFRLLAAIGGSAAMVIPRAVVRDIATGPQGARLMSQLTLVLGVVPVLAPLLGSLVLGVAGWRWIFAIATLYGVVALVAVQLALPDTLPVQMRLRQRPVEVLARMASIVREPVFLLNTCICGFASFVMFAYLSGTPVVFEKIRHFTPTEFGLTFGCNAAFFIAGTQINARIVGRTGLVRVLSYGIAAMTLGASALFVVAAGGFAGPDNIIWLTALPILTVMTAMGFLGPNATVLALSGHARHAGSASALLGTLQFSFGAVSGILMGVFSAVSVVPMAVIMVLGVSGANLAYRLFLRHHRRHARVA